MAQYQITVNQELLHRLFLSDNKDSGVAALLESVLNQILQAQATEQLEAEPYERTEERKGYRNGTYPHKLTTRVGTLTLRIPRFRNGKFSTELFARYQRSEQALVLALMEMVINGVSTRKVSQITEELCGTEFSKSTVSELCKKLDPVVHGWNNRNLHDMRYPFILVDALVLKVREEGRVRARSVMIAIGVNTDGYREILGLMLGDSESESSWGEFFTWLKSRGLRGVDIIVSDNHGGLVKAVRSHFQGVTWQRCQTHFMRNILDVTPKSIQDELYPHLRAILDAPDVDTARVLLNQTLEAYENRAPKAMKVLEDGFDDATAILILPERYRRRLRTTNGVERLNEEIRRRERVIRIFPNRESVIRLVGALLMEFDDKWASGRKYLDMSEYLQWQESQRQARAFSKVTPIR
ncbi:transposase mutator type [Desulfotomaculum nigrificans CO-1-SRB]|jgi:transposase-like protein|uniref:Mutator family transposase n=3 Tax=Eubacteriales TaxID=186802 RepID=F6B5C0_DESCC|nr:MULTISPECIES: IS256 family transposase [Eubacteriales]AEF94020.1 transposase mutator type [Desulfotomaculum nigrificans CO-1-SRB]AEF94241.1 transposase mutator type [Desulfotomaculum nigrificans CO-1-SRB]AEF94291.1 transposase mutator type [Desulfotomaculum nigrificans CO-1-SRB]AEF94470.1 transposase mutator type [Desulfotomaculum nigrificans CO-1-SRB]AEF94993.1 transposase mutator type [Desulfotomaculum nigrificans CO-1-SRB]